ncbi:MAG: hypothetical protein BWY27_00099 [Bacteroidetes bacterium ADurb.Bin234]|nr:MAG: hypothetical protein BWY27_00099 [Bacteroidetes bacterium ADurb.Bin234]
MKRVVALFFVAVLAIGAFTSCDKAVLNKYAGTYTGSMTLSTDSTKDTKENIKIIITNSLTDENILYLAGLQLTKKSDTEYALSGTQVATIIKLGFPNVNSDKIENANCKLLFSENKLDMDITYKLLDIVEVTAIKYSGTKTAEAK